MYFDRLKPKVSIEIGTLEEWYNQRYVEEEEEGRNHQAKRRRLNYTTDDIQIELS